MVCFAFLFTVLGCGFNGNDMLPSSGATKSTTATYNVTAYGAKGNGVADDGPAIQRAIAAAGRAGGGSVLIPCGEFLVSSSPNQSPGSRSLLYVNGARSIQITGDKSCSHILTRQPNRSLIEFEDSDHITITGLHLTAANVPVVEAHGMIGGSAIRLSNVGYATVSANQIDGASIGAIYLTEATHDSVVKGNLIHDTNGGGIWEDDCGGVSATTCAPSRPPSHNTYVSNTMTNVSLASSTAMTLDDGGNSSYAIVEHNSVSWTRQPVDGNGEVFCFEISNASDVKISNNICTAAPFDGIVIVTSPGAKSLRDVISKNTIIAPGMSHTGGDGISIWDTTVTGDGTSQFTISGNKIQNAAKNGIEIHSAGAPNRIHDGRITDNIISMADQSHPGNGFGIDIEFSHAIKVESNMISCDGTCMAAGILLRQNTSTIVNSTANTVSKILGPAIVVR